MAQILSSAMSGFIPTEVSTDIVKDIVRGSAVLKLAKNVPMTTPEKVVPVMTDGAGAYWVGESEKIQTSAPTWIYPKLVAKKLAVIVPMSREALNDPTVDAFNELKPTIAEAFAAAFDAAAIFGTSSPYGAGNSIFEKATTAGNAVTIGAVAGQELGGDISDLMALVEADGYDVNGFMSSIAIKNSLRKAKDDNGNAIFKDITADATAEVYGAPLAYVRNGSFDATKAQMLAGNFDYVLTGVLEDIEYKISEEATVGTTNLFEQDMVALRATMRVGFLVVKDAAFANLLPKTV